MSESTAATMERLLASFKRNYDISLFNDEQRPLKAICDYFEHNEKYILSRKTQIWQANNEEFLFLYCIDDLTEETVRDAFAESLRLGEEKLNIGSGHMCSYITTVIVCDSASDDALKLLKKCRKHKSYRFSLHGWMDYRIVALCLADSKAASNWAGKVVVKNLRNVIIF